MNAPNVTETGRQELTILVATADPVLQRSLPVSLSRMLGADCELRITTRAHERQVRVAASLYALDLVVLCVDTVTYCSGDDGQFAQAFLLVQELKRRHGVAVLLLSSEYPKGFATAAEQAGVEGMLQTPCALEELAGQVRAAVALNAQLKATSARARESRRRRAQLRPRVVIVDEASDVLELVSSSVWNCWPKATVVACPDATTARQDLV